MKTFAQEDSMELRLSVKAVFRARTEALESWRGMGPLGNSVCVSLILSVILANAPRTEL